MLFHNNESVVFGYQGPIGTAMRIFQKKDLPV
jgi:hypothetical protein